MAKIDNKKILQGLKPKDIVLFEDPNNTMFPTELVYIKEVNIVPYFLLTGPTIKYQVFSPLDHNSKSHWISSSLCYKSQDTTAKITILKRGATRKDWSKIKLIYMVI